VLLRWRPYWWWRRPRLSVGLCTSCLPSGQWARDCSNPDFDVQVSCKAALTCDLKVVLSMARGLQPTRPTTY
jgi:hypothetical protein